MIFDEFMWLGIWKCGGILEFACRVLVVLDFGLENKLGY